MGTGLWGLSHSPAGGGRDFWGEQTGMSPQAVAKAPSQAGSTPLRRGTRLSPPTGLPGWVLEIPAGHRAGWSCGAAPHQAAAPWERPRAASPTARPDAWGRKEPLSLPAELGTMSDNSSFLQGRQPAPVLRGKGGSRDPGCAGRMLSTHHRAGRCHPWLLGTATTPRRLVGVPRSTTRLFSHSRMRGTGSPWGTGQRSDPKGWAGR